MAEVVSGVAFSIHDHICSTISGLIIKSAENIECCRVWYGFATLSQTERKVILMLITIQLLNTKQGCRILLKNFRIFPELARNGYIAQWVADIHFHWYSSYLTKAMSPQTSGIDNCAAQLDETEKENKNNAKSVQQCIHCWSL